MHKKIQAQFSLPESKVSREAVKKSEVAHIPTAFWPTRGQSVWVSKYTAQKSKGNT